MTARGIVAAFALLFTLPSLAGTQTRISSFEYDPVSGRLIKEVVEPQRQSPDPDAANAVNYYQFCMATTYHYDAFGNRDKTTTRNCGATNDPTGVGTTTEAPLPTGDPAFTMRTSTATYGAVSVVIGGLTYNWSAGQFATSSANALNQSETRTFDPRFGAVASLTGPNGITTSWTYDSFGRKSTEARADNTVTSWFYERCADLPAGTCPPPAQAPYKGEYRVGTVATGSPTPITYYDSLNREIRTESQGFDGTLARKDTQYDSLGRVAQVSRPYYASASPVWTVFTYDILGRVIQTVEPVVSSGQTRTVTTYNNAVTSTTWTTTVTVSNAGSATNMPAIPA